MQKSISVVIPNYNGQSLLEANLPSVFQALKNANVEHEVIVSDDASQDDSLLFLQENYCNIVIASCDKNKGFSPTINKGILMAKKDLVFLLNSDVALLPDYFTSLFQYFAKEETFGVCGRFIGLNDEVIQDAGKYPRLLRSRKLQPFNFYVHNPTQWVPTLFLSGGGALIDRKKLFQLGGFDEIYAPFYYEDTDLSVRAWRLGWKCYYEHQAICRHPASITINKFNKKRSIWIVTQRNKLIFHSIHLSKASKLRWNSRQLITLLVQAIIFRWKYHVAFFKYLEKRSQIKQSKQRNVKMFQDNNVPMETAISIICLEIDKQNVIKL